MTYTPRPGDLAVCQVPNPVSWLIRAGQWANGDGFGPHVHAFTYLGDGLIAEARPGGAAVIELAAAGYTGIVWSYPRFDPDQGVRAAVCQAARWYASQHVGYSWLDYGSLAAHRLGIPAPHLRAYIASTGHMICSQFADRCALDGGEHLFADGRWPGDVTPGDLYHLFTGLPVREQPGGLVLG